MGKLKILCAVRGQPASRSTVQRAINLSLENDAELTFLLVLTTTQLSRAAPLRAPLRAVYQQLESLGEFSMALLQDRAEHRGLEEVTTLVRRGTPGEVIHEVVKELAPDILVMGEPVPDEPRAIFKPEEFRDFVNALGDSSQAEIVVVETPSADLPGV